MAMKDLPNPGSDEARSQGCTCPVLDNNYGEWAPRPPDGWYLVITCPIHGTIVEDMIDDAG